MSKLKRIGTIFGGAALGFAAGGPTGAAIGAYGAYKGTAKPPTSDVPDPIPVPDEEAIAAQKRKKALARAGGRDSTVLVGSDPGNSEKLGG